MNAREKAIILLLIVSGFIVHKLNVLRSLQGFDSWYADGMLITLAQIADVAFFGLFSGFIIAKILKK